MTQCGASEGVLRRTEDYEAVRRLAVGSGLEDGEFDKIVCAYGYFIDDELVGCAAMKRSEDTYSVEWLAVREQDRGRGLGRLLVEKVAADAKENGAEELWALARAPEFFLSIGFTLSSLENSPGPTFEVCRKCSQFNIMCFPKIVMKAL